jgi:hypothetical protein
MATSRGTLRAEEDLFDRHLELPHERNPCNAFKPTRS